MASSAAEGYLFRRRAKPGFALGKYGLHLRADWDRGAYSVDGLF